MDAMLNQTTNTISGNEITHFLEHPEERYKRRLAYDIAQAVIGLLIVTYNGSVLSCYFVSKCTGKTRFSNRFNFGFLALISFCFLHGLIFSVVYTVQRNYRQEMSKGACLITTLIIDFCDLFILVLLPLNAIDRLIQIKFPTMSHKKHRGIIISIFTGMVIITALVAWLPMIPGVDAIHQNYHAVDLAAEKRLNKFASAYNCGGLLNKKMKSAPYIFLGVQLACAALVISLHAVIHGYTKVYGALPQASNMTPPKNMGVVSRSALAMSIVVIATNIPYSISEVIKSHCKTLYDIDLEALECSAWLLELKFIFRILFHLGNFLAPLIYTMLDHRMRRGIKYYITHCIKKKECNTNHSKYRSAAAEPHSSFASDFELANLKIYDL